MLFCKCFYAQILVFNNNKYFDMSVCRITLAVTVVPQECERRRPVNHKTGLSVGFS